MSGGNSAIVVGEDFLLRGPHGKELKSIGAHWDEAANAWTLPATRMNAKVVNDLGLGLPDLSVGLEPTPVVTVDDDLGALYPFQRETVARLVNAPHGLLVCLSPGLGKTAVAVKAADLVLPATEQAVVITLASLLRTWEREILKWSTKPGEIYVVRGAIDHEKATAARWIVMSWDKMSRDPAIWGKGWPLFILDESVLTKSRSSKRFKALQKIRRGVDRFWLLSGSPTSRYADDLWAQLHLIWPRAFPSYWRFAERYCIVEQTPWAQVITATRAGKDAAADNSDMMIVVNQEDVLDLPEYLFEAIDVDLVGKQLKAYKDMKKNFIAELENGTEVVAPNEIAKLMKLQQIASYWDGQSAKHEALLDLIETYEKPYLIWTHWREGAEALHWRLGDVNVSNYIVTGDTSPNDRDRFLEGFKAGAVDALVLSIGVGKFGHTFTNVKTMFYLDKTWNADDYFQSLHRVRRIGLKHRAVVVSVRAPKTTDVLVEANLEGKLGSMARMTKADLATLLKGLGQ